MPEPDRPTPYAAAAVAYLDAGWSGILPLPYGKKSPPPQGWTGAGGRWPSYPDVYAWATGPEGAGNVALRLPLGIIGIDVDDYDDKHGGDTVAAAALKFGATRPATWRSTSRDDGVSGIGLYRVPEGLAWPGEVGADVETIQHTHRYCVVPPSLHPSGRTYRWITPDGAISTVMPTPDDLPALPEEWVAGLTGGVLAEETARADLGGSELGRWLLAHDRELSPCRRMRHVYDRMARDLERGSRHAAGRDTALRLVRLSTEGHAGLLPSLSVARVQFLAAVTDPNRPSPRPVTVAEAEWASMVRGAVNLVSANPTPGASDIDPCAHPLDGLISPEKAQQQQAGTPGTPPESDETDLDRLLAHERQRRLVKRTVDEEEIAATFRIPPYTPSLTAELQIPDEPVRYTVERVLPVGGNVLLTASYKTGKTIMLNNLARALADEVPFLDRFAVGAHAGRIGLWNYEVSGGQYRRWLRAAGIEHTDAIAVLNLRGFRMPVTTSSVEDWIVAWLVEQEVWLWAVDPFARAYVGSGRSENDNTEVGAFLDTLDVIKERAGVSDLILPTHTGRAIAEEGEERARGATRLDDWADVAWTLTKNDEDVRFFSAAGRDVDVPEEKLTFNPETYSLSLGGGDRKWERNRRIEAAVLAVVVASPGIVTREIGPKIRESGMTVRNETVGDVIAHLIGSRVIYTVDGVRGALLHYPTRAGGGGAE